MSKKQPHKRASRRLHRIEGEEELEDTKFYQSLKDQLLRLEREGVIEQVDVLIFLTKERGGNPKTFLQGNPDEIERRIRESLEYVKRKLSELRPESDHQAPRQ